jgi:hypothetical protein
LNVLVTNSGIHRSSSAIFRPSNDIHNQPGISQGKFRGI